MAGLNNYSFPIRTRGPDIPPGLNNYNYNSQKHCIPPGLNNTNKVNEQQPIKNNFDHITNGIINILDDNPAEDIKKKDLIKKIYSFDENKMNLVLKLLEVDITKLSIILGLIQDEKLMSSITKISHIINYKELNKKENDKNSIIKSDDTRELNSKELNTKESDDNKELNNNFIRRENYYDKPIKYHNKNKYKYKKKEFNGIKK